MTTKAGYTDDEWWPGLLETPILAGAYVAVSDMSFFGMIGEMQGLVRAMTEQPAPRRRADLMASIVADIQADKEIKEKVGLPETKNSATQAGQLVHQLGLDLEVLEEVDAGGVDARSRRG